MVRLAALDGSRALQETPRVKVLILEGKAINRVALFFSFNATNVAYTMQMLPHGNPGFRRELATLSFQLGGRRKRSRTA